ncbi:MAG: hypothetical protein OER88_06890 [Planctomycetota bacterium]|nr:hypothetical protein [Planctomycetota bacterium]
MRPCLIALIAAAIALAGCGDDRDKHDYDSSSVDQRSRTAGPDEDPDSPGISGRGQTPSGHEHGHAADARFGGKMVEIGDHFAWAEIRVDNDDGTITLWMWDAHVENPERLKMKEIVFHTRLGGRQTAVTLAAQADSLTGEKIGDTQRFLGSDRRLIGLKSVAGEIEAIDVKGITFEHIKFEWKE